MHRIDRRRFVIASAATGAASILTGTASAQLGDQPVTIVFPFGAGGSGDALARIIGDRMHAALGRPVVNENKTGAAGRIGVQAVKNAAPDGNTILITPIAPVAIYPNVYNPLGYDPFTDLQPLSQVAAFEFAVAVGPQVPAKTLKELVAWLKAHPDAANYGTPGAGTLPHFFAVTFGRATGVDLRHVSYRGSAPALNDLVGGQISIVFTTTSDLLEMHKAGRIRILATSDKARSPLLPDIPTFKESGYNIEGTSWYAMYLPAKTPVDVVTRLNKIIVEAVRAPDVKDKLLALGLYATGTSPEELARIQKADAEMWKPAIKASGFTPKQ